MHGARALIGAAQRVVHAGGGDQLTLGRLGSKTVSGNGDLAAQGNAVLILKWNTV